VTLLLRFGFVAPPARGADVDAQPTAAELLDQYLALPHPEKDDGGAARMARLKMLARLSHAPEVLPVVQSRWTTLTEAVQRKELAEMIGRYNQTPAGAAALIERLKDPDEQVRFETVHGLRLMSLRVNRSGGKRIQQGPEHPPQVEGLVPWLMVAANDASEGVRVHALFALADTRNALATQEIRNHLNDSSQRVRLSAACFLTEFQDGSGLPEMCQGLERLQAADPKLDFMYYAAAESLLASLERITGKSFGEIPMNPDFCSLTEQAETIKAQYRKLIPAWWAFISSVEGKQQIQKLASTGPAGALNEGRKR
jgi:hypothetical protein